MFKKILIVLLVILVVIQFIRPEKNQSANAQNDIAAIYTVPANVKQVLERACYDCHSNYTTYPWYSQIQPVAWWLDHHIEEGKEHVNYGEFGTYTLKKQAHKLDETAEMIEEGEMPLNSYTWMHAGARLSKEDAALLISWARGLQHEIEAKL